MIPETLFRAWPARLTIVLILFASPGCGGGPAAPIPSPGEIAPVFDEASAVSETIDASGSTIRLRTADGADVTVTFPAGAFRSPTAVTVVPFIRLEGAPFDALVGAVDIRPAHLMFSTPVMITIQSDAPPPGPGMAFMLDEADGVETARSMTAGTRRIAPGVFLVDCPGGTKRWTIGVGVSGGVGIARSTVLAALGLLDLPPASLTMQMRQRAGRQIYAQENLERFASGDCDRTFMLPIAHQAMIDTYTGMFRSAAQAARSSDGMDFFDVLGAYLNWGADAQMLGIEGEAAIQALNDEGAGLVNQAAVNAANQYLSHCGESGFDELVLSVLGRRGLDVLLAAPQLPFLAAPELAPDALIQRLQDCLGCDDVSVLEVRPPALPLVGSLGRFDIAVTGSTTEDTRFTWDFGEDVSGDDRVRHEASPLIHLPAKSGTYTGVVTVENDCTPVGFQDSHTFTYTVIDCVDPSMGEPVSVTSVSPLSGEPATRVTFRADVSGPVAEYTWDFGDGANPRISHEAEPTVTLAAERAEPYLGSLSVGNACRSSEPFIFEYRSAPCHAPVITAVEPGGGFTGGSVEFSADVDHDPTTFAWDFGGGALPRTSAQSRPVVTLGSPGTYTGTLAVSNECGTSEAFSFEYIVGGDCHPSITAILPRNGSTGRTVQFCGGVTPEGATFDWNFGGGATPNRSTDATPTVTFAEPGLYQLTLRVSNDCGSDESVLTYGVFSGELPEYMTREYHGTWSAHTHFDRPCQDPIPDRSTSHAVVVSFQVLTETVRLQLSFGAGAITFPLDTFSESGFSQIFDEVTPVGTSGCTLHSTSDMTGTSAGASLTINASSFFDAVDNSVHCCHHTATGTESFSGIAADCVGARLTEPGNATTAFRGR